MNLYEKIQNCRVELQTLNLKKGGKNAFANFQYYQLDDFIPALNEIVKANKLFTMFNIKEGIATLTIIDSEKPTDQVVFESPIASADIKGSTPIQCLGGIHTYMKRYLYQNAFEITEPDLFDSLVKSGKLVVDNDKNAQNTNQTPLKTNVVEVVANAEAEEISTIEQIEFIKGMGDNVVKWALKKFNIQFIEELTYANAQYIINSYKNKNGGK